MEKLPGYILDLLLKDQYAMHYQEGSWNEI